MCERWLVANINCYTIIPFFGGCLFFEDVDVSGNSYGRKSRQSVGESRNWPGERAVLAGVGFRAAPWRPTTKRQQELETILQIMPKVCPKPRNRQWHMFWLCRKLNSRKPETLLSFSRLYSAEFVKVCKIWNCSTLYRACLVVVGSSTHRPHI